MSNVEDNFKKFSDLNFSGGLPLGELLMTGDTTPISRSQIKRNSITICYEAPIYKFNKEENK